MSEKIVTHSQTPEGQHISETKVKSGIKTTEFWVSLAAAVASFVVAQGIITDDQVAAVVAVAGPVVSALGYTISRGIAKK